MYVDIAAHRNEFREEAAVPCPTLEGLFGQIPAETFDAGTAVFWEGDPATHVFSVEDGVLRIFKILSDGRRVITGFVYPGDLVGISLKDRYLYSAEAVVPVKLRRFARSRFQDEINRAPELRPQLFARLCDEMAAAQDQMVLLARKSAEERVASFLLLCLRRRAGGAGAPATIDLPMTRLDMADYLGLTIETVSRSMTKLAGRGVIAACGRHAIAVRKPALLAQLAGEDENDDGQSDVAYTRAAVWPN